jgi:ABC-type glycerol-3-phosphate transport system substrate-binding protein
MREGRASRKRLRLLLPVGVIAAAAVAIWLIAGCGGGDDTTTPTASEEVRAPEAVTAAQLGEFADEAETTIYWAGEQPGTTIELSTSEGGRTYVRYLTGGAEPGDARADFLTVGSYQFADPVAALEALAKEPGGVQRTVPGGGVAYFNRERPQNVYLAYPDQEVEIEVFDPEAGRAKELVTTGQIVAVG